MTPDPADRLARFTPAAGPDPADLLFRMGRASAPTRLRWKLAVVGLLVSNAVTLCWVVCRPAPKAPAPEVVPVVIPVPVPAAVSPPLSPEPACRVGDFWVRDDPDLWPTAVPISGMTPPGPPLTPLAARRGEID